MKLCSNKVIFQLSYISINLYSSQVILKSSCIPIKLYSNQVVFQSSFISIKLYSKEIASIMDNSHYLLLAEDFDSSGLGRTSQYTNPKNIPVLDTD